MKKSIYIFLFLLLTIFIGSAAYLVYKIDESKSPSLDIVVVNDIVQSVKSNWSNLESISADKYKLEYSVLDAKNNVIAKTSEGLNADINAAICHRDTIVDVYDEDTLLGKLIIYNNYNESLYEHRKNLYMTCIAVLSVFMVICVVFAYYVYRVIYRPFNKLQIFAKNVAAGDLNIPLEMDKQNIFGAFTESFDLMRDELKLAREAEQQANKSKKELVAQLSHDIKTPVASIKAVSELLTAKVTEKNEISQNDMNHLDAIGKKADQINTLITNMFNATLEELQELKVQATAQSSLIIYDIIRSTDYFHKIETIQVDECLIYADTNRLTQVIDNIISNSYKYAGTEIKLHSFFDDGYLIVEFIDFGKGVDNDELPLLFDKFYRAKNTEGKSGAGLGLYISRYLMNKMDGDITCENIDGGFKIMLMIKLI